MAQEEDRDWQRLDKWLWCARFMKVRAACARWVAEGSVRINRQPTDKPHARVRPGDVLTLPAPDGVRVIRVLALAARRGPAPEARQLYAEINDPMLAPTTDEAVVACAADKSSAYRHLAIGPTPDKERL
jgi:ribosome-associated heat shock protein Hsp15